MWLRLPSGRCDPVEVDIDPPDTLAALTKWERVTGRTDLCVVTVRPAPPGAGPPNPVLGLPAIAGEPADTLLDHLTDGHGIGTDTGRFVLHAQGVVASRWWWKSGRTRLGHGCYAAAVTGEWVTSLSGCR